MQGVVLIVFTGSCVCLSQVILVYYYGVLSGMTVNRRWEEMLMWPTGSVQHLSNYYKIVTHNYAVV